MRVAIHQPNYIPWCGFFAKMRASDLFIFLDDVQMPLGRSYVSRAKVLMQEGPKWLAVPIHHGADALIRDVSIAEEPWQKKHLGTLRASYARCPHFDEVMQWLVPLYDEAHALLAPFNMLLIRSIAAYLGIGCQFAAASALAGAGQGDDHLIDLLGKVGARTYVSGAGGQSYQDPEKFRRHGLVLEVRAYQPIAYRQQAGGFVPGLSIVDALFETGKDARQLLGYE